MAAEGFLVWLALFVVLALMATVPVHFHLKSMGKAAGGERQPVRTSGAQRSRPCPQCGHRTGSDAAFCDKCGVPMMLWELKLSRQVQGNTPKSGERAKIIPIIAQDLCIGCSACVNACETNVLEIVAGKSTVTNLGACTGAAVCADVCPTGACQLTGAGAGGRRVEVPQIAADFETNVAGVYAIGELGGLGLIKNAVNEGALVIEGLKNKHRTRPGVLDFVIVGAGPAGLSASLAAKDAGFEAIVVEQGSFADTIRRFPNKKIVMAEPVRVPMYGSLWISDAPKETLLGVWQSIIDSAGVAIHEGEQVTDIERTDGGLLGVKTTRARYEAQRVILAIGKRGTPRRLEVPGAERSKVMYSLTDAAKYRTSRILVVGGGDSAAEAAIGLASQEGNSVTLSYRKKSFSRLKTKNERALKAALQSGKVRFIPESQVGEVRSDAVVLHTANGGRETLENDFVFAMIGGTSPNAFLQRIGIDIVTKEISMTEQRIPA